MQENQFRFLFVYKATKKKEGKLGFFFHEGKL